MDVFKERVVFIPSCWVAVVVAAYGVLFKHPELLAV